MRWMGLLLLLTACRETAPAPAEPIEPPPPAIPGGSRTFEGGPELLTPHLTPRQPIDVELRADPDPTQPVVGTCRLVETDYVPWTRSRVRVQAMGRLRALETVTIERVKKLVGDRVDPESLDKEPLTDLELDAGQKLDVWAVLRGRCLAAVGDGPPRLAIPCPVPRTELRPEPDQTWWLEIGCSTGEGWFEVDRAAFDIEQFPTRKAHRDNAP